MRKVLTQAAKGKNIYPRQTRTEGMKCKDPGTGTRWLSFQLVVGLLMSHIVASKEDEEAQGPGKSMQMKTCETGLGNVNKVQREKP